MEGGMAAAACWCLRGWWKNSTGGVCHVEEEK